MKIMKIVLLMGMLLYGLAFAEDIELKDGTKITGEVVSFNSDKFQIKTSYGEITVPKKDVISITFPENKAKEADKSTPKPDLPKMEDELQGTTYTNHTEKFQVEVPKGWLMAPEARSKSIASALKSPDESQIFMVTPEKFEGPLKTYKVMAETQMETSFSEYQKVSDSEIMLDGKNCARIVIQGRVKAAGDTPMKFLVLIVPYPDRMVRLSFLTLTPLFDDALPTFEKIAASYKTIAK